MMPSVMFNLILSSCMLTASIAFVFKSPNLFLSHGKPFSERARRKAAIPYQFQQTQLFTTHERLQMSARKGESPNMGPSEEELAQQKIEAIREYSNYHDGVWHGKRVTSFSISSDVAAGVTKRLDKKSTTGNEVYTTSIRTLLEADGLRVQETISWGEDSEEQVANGGGNLIASRTVKLSESVDIDAVDGSYSLDSSPLLDIPSVITGTNAVVKFGIEHCIAVSEQERVRCFLMYDVEDKLARIVLCDEVRVKQENGDSAKDGVDSILQLSAEEEIDAVTADVDRLMGKLFSEESSTAQSSRPTKNNNGMEMASSSKNKITEDTSIDEKMEKLQRALQSANGIGSGGRENSGSSDNSLDIKRNPMSMFGLISGVWLGDCFVRDHFQPSRDGSSPSQSASKGFGGSAASLRQRPKPGPGLSDGFAEWSTGVQKVAITFKWDFDERVMQRVDAGRNLGASISSKTPATSMGNLITNDMARGRDPEDRLAYVDFDMGMYAGFLLGSVYIKAPRSLSFSYSTGKVQPFLTEFAVFLKKVNGDATVSLAEVTDGQVDAPELYCSRLTRLYGNNGRLIQGTSAFFKLESIASKQ